MRGFSFRRFHRPHGAVILTLACAGAITACGSASDISTQPASGKSKMLVIASGLPALDANREGHYVAWLVDASGAPHVLGRLTGGGLTVAMPSERPASIQITVESPASTDATPSAQVVLRGAMNGGLAALTYQGAVTQGDLPLRDSAGQFTMFTPSDNATEGYPSHEEAGVWLFNMDPGATPQRDYYVRMTQLQPGWTYEGWMVRDIDSPSAVWLSYGKFVPDWTGALNSPDDTGWGPFSGVLDFRVARLEDFPGDDWISNPLNYPLPAGLSLPLDLREKDASGRLRWSHVISIEPAIDRGEAISTERPFFMRPYRDSFGDQPAGVARKLTLHADAMPTGSAEVR